MKPSNSGWSDLAIRAHKEFRGKLRPKGWRRSVYGLVVHTTGRSLPKRALEAGQTPLKRAVDYYTRESVRGCHYVIPYDGQIFQIANEDEQAWGVSFSEQRESIRNGWEKDLPLSLVKRWRDRWPEYEHPGKLLPGTRTVNSCYVHVECIPVIPETRGDISPDTLFTRQQYRAVAHLAMDVAYRNDWPGEWWKTPRLVGHEDLTPITRHTKLGGWDPGFLRAKPYFDWCVVWEELFPATTRCSARRRPPRQSPVPRQ